MLLLDDCCIGVIEVMIVVSAAPAEVDITGMLVSIEGDVEGDGSS